MKLTYSETAYSRVIWMEFDCNVVNYNQLKSPMNIQVNYHIWIWKEWEKLHSTN